MERNTPLINNIIMNTLLCDQERFANQNRKKGLFYKYWNDWTAV